MNTIIPQDWRMRSEIRRRIRQEVEVRFSEQRSNAGFWRRLLIDLAIEREVEAEMKRRFPPRALYLAR